MTTLCAWLAKCEIMIEGISWEYPRVYFPHPLYIDFYVIMQVQIFSIIFQAEYIEL